MKTTVLLRPNKALFDDRFSERKEKALHGRLKTADERFGASGLANDTANDPSLHVDTTK